MYRSLFVLLTFGISVVHDAHAASDEIFANGFEEIGFAIPLSSPEGADELYDAQVSIGNQVFALSIDTGSTTLGVAGATCTAGCTGVSPRYTPSSTATDTGLSVSTMYADGSGWSGTIYSDTVGLGEGSPSVELNLADITHASSFFFENDYQGILGLGPQQNAEPNTTGYIPLAVSSGLNDVFAFELCDTTGGAAGTLWLGGDGSPGAVQRTPLVPISNSNPFYAINVNGMSLGTTVIASNASSTFQQPVIDTGTSLFYVPTSVYTAFKSALSASSQFKTLFGNRTFSSDCVTDVSVTDADVESQLPLLALSVPNATSGQSDVVLQAGALDTYLYNAGGGQYCLAIQDGGTQDASTFGDAFMQAFHIVIDVDGGRVEFAEPTSCASPQIRRIHHPTQTGPHRPPRWPRP